jgi:hypothetical protein
LNFFEILSGAISRVRKLSGLALSFESARNINHIGVSGFIPPGAPNFHHSV